VSFAAGSCARGGIPPSSRRQRGLGSASDVVRLCDATSGPRPGRGAQAKAVHAGTISKKAVDRGEQREGGREGGREGERESYNPHPHPHPQPHPHPHPHPHPRAQVLESAESSSTQTEKFCAYYCFACGYECVCVFTRARVCPCTRECETLCAIGGVTKFVYPSLCIKFFCMGHMHARCCMCVYMQAARR